MEKIKTEKIKNELKKTNFTLKKYSNKIEELTVTKETSRFYGSLSGGIKH